MFLENKILVIESLNPLLELPRLGLIELSRLFQFLLQLRDALLLLNILLGDVGAVLAEV